MEGIRQVFGNPGDTWDPLSWDSFTKEEKEAWGVLGWTRAGWEEETRPPDSNSKYWGQLSAPERLAAQALGYTQPTWDA